MGKAVFWQRGDAIDYKNNTASKIDARDIVVFGTRIGIAGTDIKPGETGSLIMTSTWEIPKDNAAITAGADVYFKDTAASATKGAGFFLIGYAVEAAAADDTTVKVKLLG